MDLLSEPPDLNDYKSLDELDAHFYGIRFLIVGITEVKGVTFINLKVMGGKSVPFQCRFGEAHHHSFEPREVPGYIRDSVNGGHRTFLTLAKHARHVAVNFETTTAFRESLHCG